MNLIGFSTGSLALSDYKKALADLEQFELVNSIELSALREEELEPLVNDLEVLNLSKYKYISFHSPSKLNNLDEETVVDILKNVLDRKYPIVVHPNIITDFDLWQKFGDLLLIENMDKRKSIGRTLKELDIIFDQLPQASLCFDIAHALQIDSSMYESKAILKKYSSKLKQLHISEVNSGSKHERMSWEAILAFRRVADLIPDDIPIIIESPVAVNEVKIEIENVYRALGKRELDVEFA